MRSLPFKPVLILALLGIFVSIFPVAAQDSGSSQTETEENSSDSDWFYGKLIRSVSFKGLENVDRKDVDGVTSSFVGKKFDDDVFEDLINRVYALDLFEEINPQAVAGDSKKSTVAIVLSVTERPVISRIIFRGNKQVRTAELKETISIKEKDVYIESKALIAERAIRDLYLGKGFTQISVSSSVKKGKRGMELTFLVKEGFPTVIKTIEFQGNNVFSDRTLRRKLKLKEVGLFNKGAFQESSLEADKQAVLAFYNNNGYIDAEVIDITKTEAINEKKERNELTITFILREGGIYTFGGVTFEGNKIFSTEDLRPLIKLKDGATFNQTKFQEGLMAVTDKYYENGYTANRFEPVDAKDPENKTISFNILIMENARSHIENIIIKGNTKTKEKVIRREIPIDTGDIFSKTKITTGLRNLYNLQYFSAIVPNVIGGSEENLVDLVFSVEEQSTTSIEFGVTFSGVSDAEQLPFALFVKWQDSNLFGTGKNVGLSTTLASDEQSATLSFGQDWIGDIPLSFSLSTGFSHSKLSALRTHFTPDGIYEDDTSYMDYEQLKWTSGISLGRRWTPDWAILSLSGGVTGSLKSNKYNSDLYTPVDTSVSSYANKWGWQNSVWTSFSIDDRDVNYDPSTGWFASQRLTWYGLTPWEDEYFLRTDTKLERYFTLFNVPITEKWNWKMVLFMYSGLSLEFPKPNTAVGASSKLYIDGMFNGRGWTDIYNDHRGRALWSNIVELRMPVVPGVLAVDWFGDAAVVKNSPYDMFHHVYKESFFFSTGPGIRFTIPQFPLRLLFANTFEIVDDEIVWDKKWSFVLSFNITNK